MSQARKQRRHGRRGITSRLFIVLTSAVMTVSPSGASVFAADEPAPSGGTVDGTVWVDIDGDGVRGDGEEGLAGITMLLRTAAGTVTSSESKEDGRYELIGAPDGDYWVETATPAGYEVSPIPETESEDGAASNTFTAVEETAHSETITLASGTELTLNLGLVPTEVPTPDDEPTETTTNTTTTVPEATTTTTVPPLVDDEVPDDEPVFAPLSENQAGTTTHQNTTNFFGEPVNPVFYAYVEAGETLDVLVNRLSGGTQMVVTVDGPGIAETCTATTPTNTCQFTGLSSAEAGIWRIDVRSNVANPPGFSTYTWQIDVNGPGGSIDGRVWSEQYPMAQETGTPDVTFWYQSEQGVTYETTHHAYHGAHSVFRADATGVRENGTCTSAEASIGLNDPDYSATLLGECGDPFKIFFEEPAGDLPASTTRWDGDPDWIAPPYLAPDITEITFNPDSTTIRSGAIDYEIDNFTGQLVVEIDTNNDGIFDGPEDREVSGSAVGGVGSVDFDGNDGNGDPVSPFQNIGVRVSIAQAGEIHFMSLDVEIRAGGIEVTKLNGPDAGDTTIYWDDTGLTTTGQCSPTPQLDGTAGVASAGGVHQWANCTGGRWGDNRIIDDWAYVTVDETMEILVPGDVLPPFVCDSTAYLFQNVPTDIHEGDLVTGVFGEVASDIEDTHINGIGFNPLDGYIYGWSNSAEPGGTSYPAGLVRIGSDFNVEYLGIPAGLSEATLIGHGDVDTNGYYWARRSDLDPDQWLQIDLRPGEPTFGDIVASGDLVPPTGFNFLPDWSYNPVDGLLYGIGAEIGGGPSGARHLISFDPDTKAVNDEGQLLAINGGTFGATYVDANGFLYASDNFTGDIYRINVADATAEFFVDGPGSGGQNDGARCADAPLPVDFGDAPGSYGTLLADAGPRHAIPGYDAGANRAPLMLGTSIDVETDGQPSADADGDGADDDGVADPIVLIAGQPTPVTVNVTNDTGEPATLAGWIDLNNDGTFTDDERVVVPVTTSGDYELDFPPASFGGSGTYARFRLFPGDVTEPSPTGPASAGEVEDYPAEGPVITPPLLACTAEQLRNTQRYWFFGNSAAIDFGETGTTPTASDSGSQVSAEGTTVVTDTAGQLQFWSNASTIYDRTGAPMQNGTGILGNDSSVQTVAAFPAIGRPGIYFVVATSGEVTLGTGRLTYSEVDMSLNGGLGAVTATKNVNLGAAGAASESLTAVPNDDGTGFWVITHPFNSPNILAYEFNSLGPVTGTAVTTVLPTSSSGNQSSISFSADLTQAVNLLAYPQGTPSKVRVLDFDASTGQFYETLSWDLAPSGPAVGFWYSADFSPSGDYVYVSQFAGARLFRYQIEGATTGAEVLATELPLGQISAVQGGYVRRGPDGKMYVAANGTATLSVINDPDNPTDPDFVPSGLALATGSSSRYGLPQMVTGCPPPLAIDFGDAPDDYGTTLADDGARHVITDDLYLGAAIDAEDDGQPGPGADGDGADEDGVADPIELVLGQPTTVSVAVANDTDEPATLAGWIDRDRNGAFDPAERVMVTIPANTTGDFDLVFAAPVPAGDTFARFRLFPGTVASPLPTGAASAGEVEDYPVEGPVFTPPASCTPEEELAIQRFWYFGDGAGMDFEVDGSDPVFTGWTGNFALEGSTVVTDTSGLLQFTSNGQTIWDQNHDVMQNGTGLIANDSAVQTVVSFPAFGRPGVYYVVSNNSQPTATGGDLYWHEVDMNANGGLGAVTVKNQPLGGAGTATEALSAIPNADGTGFWVLTFTNNSPNFLAHEFHDDGPTGNVVTSVLPTNNLINRGSINISPDGTRLVQLTTDHSSTMLVRVLGFDAASGQVVESLSWTVLNGLNTGYTAEFSPGGDYVYVTEYASADATRHRLWRYRIADATSGAEVKATEEQLNNSTTRIGGHVKRGPDGRMYVAINGADHLAVIENPDDPVDPGFVYDGFDLGTAESTYGLPQMVTGCPPPLFIDFGDAPEGHGTLAVDNGARHIVPGYDPDTNTAPLMLGSLIDVEDDGFPSLDADGDDASDVDDEDAFPGVVSLPPGVSTFNLDVPVANTTGGQATLYAWIDADGDGSFQTDESATVTVPDGATTATLTWSGLSPLVDGTSPVLRFRLTTDTLVDNPATPVDERALGGASDGEVEDHLGLVATPFPLSCTSPYVEDFGAGPGRGPALPIGQTTYTYDGTGWVIDGTYTIIGDPAATGGPWWHSGTDHTGDPDGRMMLINASLAPGLFFQRTFTGLTPGSVYDFSAWITNANNIGSPSLPNVTFRVVDPATGTVLASADTGDLPNTPSMVWVRDGLPFTATQATVRLEMVNNSPGGNGNDLAIDDIVFAQVCEFGDAPDGYGTTLAAGGAGHIVADYDPDTGTSSLMLGSQVDVEQDGLSSGGADGDDLDGSDDEDGVANPIHLIAGDPVVVDVLVTNDTDQPATLAGWVDLDGNGTFDAGDRSNLVTVPANTTGTYTLTFPPGTTMQDTYARFRLFPGDEQDPQPTGTASAGEVEDYPVLAGRVHYEKTVTPDDVAILEPGDSFTYTVTVTNTGSVPLTGLSFADDLSNVVDDATYNGDVAVVSGPGVAVFNAPDEIEWTLGAETLGVGAVAVIEYSVTIDDPPGGDATLLNGVVGTGPSNCIEDPPVDPDCFKEVPQPQVSGVKTSDAAGNVEAGDTITYTFTITNTGPAPALNAVVYDALSGVLDDASYNGDAVIDPPGQGSVVFQPGEERLRWNGPLGAAGDADDSVTITYTVTVNDATELGDGSLENALLMPGCPNPPIYDTQHTDYDPDCVEVNEVEAWTAVKTSDAVGNVEPGDTVGYTITVENTGGVDLPTATMPVVNVDDLTEVLDDATYDGNADDGGHAGGFVFAAPTLTWSGDLAVDEVVTLTYSVTVNDATDLGDGELLNAITGSSNCPDPAITDPEADGYDPDCVPIVDVEAWTAVKTSDAVGNVEPGDTVGYEITVENTGNVAVTAINIDDLTEVLDDASYDGNGDDGGHPGNFDFTAPELTWTGDLAVDETVTLTYSVTVNDATDLGDGVLLNAITGSSNCPDPAITDPDADGYDPDCVPIVDVEAWTAVKTSDAAGNVEPGDTVNYTITVTNTGNVPLTGADVVNVDDLTEVLDDASYDGNGDDGGHPGNFVFAAPTLTWSGDLDVDETVTITYSVTVNDATELGDGVLLNAITGSSNCPDPAITDPDATGYDPDCVNPESVEAWTVVKTSDAVDPVLPGDVVGYTVMVTNTGAVDLVGPDAAFFDDDLSGVLDDASFNDDESADVGTATFSDPEISWIGDLGVDEVATVTYSVTVDQPIGGDHQLVNAVTGGDCPDPAITDPEDAAFDETCVTVDPLPGVDITKVIFGDPVTDLQPGDTFEYVVTVENIGEVDLVGETFSDDLSEVLDDAELDHGSLTADIGVVNYAAPELTWVGDLAIGETATIRYSITINDPITGDAELLNAVVGPIYSNCVPPDPADPDCWEETPLPNVHVSKELVGPENPQPGDVVTYQITAENRGGASALDEPITDDLSGVLDDAVYNGDASATGNGDLSYAAPTLGWFGDIAAGETVIITYSVTVNAAGDLGDAVLENTVTGGENCPEDTELCTTGTPLPTYEAVKTMVSPDQVEAGDTVTYQVEVTNTSSVTAESAVVTDDLSGVLDDAVFNNDAAATAGVVSYSQPTLTWNGSLDAGETITVTYSVTVNPGDELGDGMLENTVTAPNCGDTPDLPVLAVDGCATLNEVGAVQYEKTIISPQGSIQSGDTVTYRVTVWNVGTSDLTGLEFNDDLSDVLQHATFEHDQQASTGTVTYQSETLTWTGDLAARQIATVTYSVQLDSEAPAGSALDNVVTGNGPGSNCPSDSNDPVCIAVLVVSASSLPFTGANLTYLIIAALLILALGVLTVMATRRRRES